MKDKWLFYMPKSLTFIFIAFMIAKVYLKKFCFTKHRMTSPHKIVINVDIGMLLTWNLQKTFKTKFHSLKNCERPNACRNFSILKEKFCQGKIYPPLLNGKIYPPPRGISCTCFIGRKNVGKKWQISLPMTNFFADYLFYRRLFLPTINFYRRIFLPTFFLQTITFNVF